MLDDHEKCSHVGHVEKGHTDGAERRPFQKGPLVYSRARKKCAQTSLLQDRATRCRGNYAFSGILRSESVKCKLFFLGGGFGFYI